MRHTTCAILLAAFALLSCGENSESPQCEQACINAPTTVCDGNSLVSFAPLGACVDGACVYTESRAGCPAGCSEGECLGACSGVTCTDPPAAGCDGTVLRVSANPGSCDDDTGECEYAVTETDCADADQECTLTNGVGTCVAIPETCDDEERNGEESDVDCGGSVCAPCLDESRCREGDDCASGICAQRECVAPSCVDGVRNGDEGDIDCGGACPACLEGRTCSVAEDCRSAVCDDGLCRGASCVDGVQNGGELGIDCGSSDCPGCEIGAECRDAGDCASAFCSPAGACAESACDDGVLGGTETDVDCGGVCDGCPGGSLCSDGEDCNSTLCDDGSCVGAGCDDGIANGDESDIDCGGPDCAGCAGGAFCFESADCDSSVCTDGACEPATCVDGRRNGLESGVDCGGPDCALCGENQPCAEPGDCASGVCSGRLCRADRCDDGVANGSETDTDCGGSCDPCTVGSSCEDGADCLSSTCERERCVAPPSCSDGIHNGTESDVDCGGTSCEPCGVGADCLGRFDCVTANCVAGRCGPFGTCLDGEANGAETATDCGGPTCEPCTVGLACARHRDCLSRVCIAETCTESSCSDSVRGGGETDVDCGGGACEPCGAGLACRLGDDCASGICTFGSCARPTCGDGVRNGDEAGVDCGGSCAPECPLDCGLGTRMTDLNASEAGAGRWVVPNTNNGTGAGALTPPVDCSAAASGPEHAFRFTAAESGHYRFATGGAGSLTTFDTVLYALDAECRAGATVVACNDDDGAETSTIELALDRGQTVYVVADSKSPAAASSSLSLHAEIVELRCANGVRDGDETDVDCGGAECAACGFPGTCDNGALDGDEVTKDCGPACGDPPASCVEECIFPVTAIDLGLAFGGDFGGVTTGFGDSESRFEPSEPGCFTGPTAGEVLYRYAAPYDGRFEFAVSATGVDAMIYLLDRRCAPDASELACADRSTPDDPNKSEVAVDLFVGQVVFVVVDSAAEPIGAHSFTLTVFPSS